MMEQVQEQEQWKQRFLRERELRKEAENLLEKKATELYEVNLKLEKNLVHLSAKNEELEQLNQHLATTDEELRQNYEELKEKEDEIVLQNDALKKSNAELDNFVYRVSHDLRAPITSSLGLTTLCLRLNPDIEIKELLDKQLKSLEKLDRFIQDILNYSRNTRLGVQKRQVTFNSFVEEIVGQYSATQSNVDVRISVEQTAPLVTDETRLTMIFNNLISNSFKFLASYKEESFIEISAKILSETATFIVSDNGIGIKQEFQNKIFDMFVRATDSNYGSGLGLYIAKEAVEKMGGKIVVESEYGKGTSFTITLPNHSLAE